MSRMAELAHEQWQQQDEQEAMFQLSQEREQMAMEAAKRIAMGLGGRRELEILCREAGIESPYR